jgi:integrase
VVKLSENPAAEIKAYPANKAEVYVPPQEDIDRLIATVKTDKYLVGRHPDTEDYLWVMRDCFARSIEVNRLQWKDVSFQGQGTITLRSYKSKGSNERKRTLPMTNEIRQRLWRRYQHRDPEISWVFWHEYTYRKGPKKGETVRKSYEDRRSFMRTLCRKAGIKYFRFHPLRHAGASMLADKGVAPNTIQEMLGHSNLKTTERYLHSVKGAVRDAMATYEESRSKFTTDSRQVVPFGKVETR